MLGLIKRNTQAIQGNDVIHSLQVGGVYEMPKPEFIKTNTQAKMANGAHPNVS